MTASCVTVGPKSNDTVPIRHTIQDTDTEEKPREDGGRDRRGVATSPGMPGAQKLEDAGGNHSLESLEGVPCDIFHVLSSF